jgi:hypothetical protein
MEVLSDEARKNHIQIFYTHLYNHSNPIDYWYNRTENIINWGIIFFG